MSVDYQSLILDYRRSPDQEATGPARHPVVVVGAGPVGLTTAIDLAQRGVRVVLLDDDHRLSFGSRGLCYAKRTLEIFDRLGCGQRMVDKGVSWKVGKVFFQDALAYEFDLLPETGHRRPAFINLQQYYLEGYLHDHAATLDTLDIRWRNRVVGVVPGADGVDVTIDTPEGPYTVRCDYLVACDGSRSPVRGMMGLESKGRVFRDRFLIADVRMTAEFPTERWFWFDPPFHRNQSVLLHSQPDNVWRIDFQLGWDADPEEEKRPDKVIPRIRALLGTDVDFTLDWVSVYTFACQRMDDFRHGRVLFAGDAAHGVSPFGARGANSGVQDADNLAWKLHLVLDGRAPDRLLDSYAEERQFAADENILNSTRSTDFITPKSEVSRLFRDAVLSLSRECAFARRLVNSGRLSVPAVLAGSPLNTPDRDAFAGAMVPGAPAADAPVRSGGRDGWFLDHAGTAFTHAGTAFTHAGTAFTHAGTAFTHAGTAFTAACFAGTEPLPDALVAALHRLAEERVPVRPVVVVPPGTAAGAMPGLDVPGLDVVEDAEGLLAQRYDARLGTVYLLRPDQHVCARWRAFDAAQVRDAVATATGNAGADA